MNRMLFDRPPFRQLSQALGMRGGLLLAGLALLLAAAGGAWAAHLTSDTEGHSTLEQQVGGDDPQAGFSFLRLAEGERPHQVREVDPSAPIAKPGRDKRRRSLIYFGQLSDFQLSDEESPVRVEFLDGDPSGTAKSAWRPQEALVPHATEMSIRQMNAFRQSPVPEGDGRRASLSSVIITGDLADNQQKNETEWVLTLLEGGTLSPGSGTSDLAAYDPFCATQAAAGTLDRQDSYTGVQDYDDYIQSPAYYDPDEPAGSQYGDWPRYPGLMDRAQDPFLAQGLDVPSYVSPGNHDVLVQGNEDANAAYEQLATGCVKPMTPAPGGTPDAAYFQTLASDDPSKVMLVPPDPTGRWFVDKRQYRAIFAGGKQSDDHGFAYVDPSELEASDGAASYYSFSPKPGIRLISLDTSSQGGSFVFGPGTDSISTTDRGNVDDPQFVWLENELKRAASRNELVIPFSHHALDSMDYTVADEAVPPCTGSEDGHEVEGVGHDPNPGCDRDPRSSTPLHFGDDLKELFFKYPNVIAYVAGHSHSNEVEPYREEGGSGRFWQIKSPAVADWPSVQRLVEVMDNRDGTLSIFGTLIDHAAPAQAPRGCSSADAASCPDVDSFDVATLAAIGRTLTYNDPQVGPGPDQGGPVDRNVELLVADPRANEAAAPDDTERGEGPSDDGAGRRDAGGDGGGDAGGGDPDPQPLPEATDGRLPFAGLPLLPAAAVGVALAAAGALVRRRLST